MDKKPLIILTGPTAIGKTETSIQLAKSIGGEIISADSMQVYKGMDIGTAKIKKEEMQGVPHYLIDCFMPNEEFNVMIFQKMAKQYMEDIYKRGKIPILVGGTGFYIQSVLYDIQFTKEQKPDDFRNRLALMLQKNGKIYIHDMLRKVDPASADTIHPHNTKRVIRALEYYHYTGERFSVHNERERQKQSPYRFLYIVLDMERDVLYERINKRVDQMMKEGLPEEVHSLLKQGYDEKNVSMQGLGYKELLPALRGEYTMEEAVYRLKRDTRHFAKRQMTWFRREKDVSVLKKTEYTPAEQIVEKIEKMAQEKGVLE